MLGRRKTSQIIVCRPRHRFFFLSSFLRQCRWMDWCARSCIYPAASDRSIRQADGTAGGCPSALPRRIRRCGSARDSFSFRYVSVPQLVSGTFARPSHSLYKRKDDECTRRVNREHGSITSKSACSPRGDISIFNPPTMHTSANNKCDNCY